ncbi:MAG: methyltransferase domain-containing protein [Betaproteobacteria bacterium]|nr:methyltransferase domain-containing protein [Betaproteobacteria bacterium]
MDLKRSYTLIAPLYDLLVAAPLAGARKRSLARLPQHGALDVFINGIGTGLDLPLPPPTHRYVGLDLTRAMLERVQPRRGGLDLATVQGDSQRLPFRNNSFDIALLHLILAIVPDPVATLRETARVLKPGGRVLVLDKFLRVGQAAPLRRAFSPWVARIATRLDVVFEEVLAAAGELELVSDERALARGWFRSIELRKRA